MYPKQSGRRRFLTNSAAFAGLAVAAVRSASGSPLGADTPAVRPEGLHAYGERSHLENSIRKGSMGLFDAPLEGWSSFVAPVIALAAGATVLAQTRTPTPRYNNVGRTPTDEEVQAWDIAIGTEGKELPPGSGTAKEGAKIFSSKCAVCHGANLEGSQLAPGDDRWELLSVCDDRVGLYPPCHAPISRRIAECRRRLFPHRLSAISERYYQGD